MYDHVFQFFGLRENPFHVSPDPQSSFLTPSHRKAFEELTMGVDARRGLFVLTGEAGTGKTILLHQFLNHLESRQQSSCYIFQSQLKPLELFEQILQDFGIPCHSRHRSDLLMELSQWLLTRSRMGDSPVLVIDEAQATSLRTLNRLNMLLDLEAEGSKLLQIVLSGQPQLEEKLRRPELRQLQRRIMFGWNLEPLSMEETSTYIRSRLTRVGAKGTTIFSDESLEATQFYAQGIPRVLNLLCEHALVAAYSEKCKVIPRDLIERVAADFNLNSYSDAAEQEILPRFGRLIPLSPSKKMASEIAHAAEQFATEMATVPEQRAIIRPEPEATLITSNSCSTADAALEKPVISALPRPVAIVSPVIPPITPKVVEQKPPKRTGRPEIPVNWSRPSIVVRLAAYWSAAERTFTRGRTQFLHACTKAKPVLQLVSAEFRKRAATAFAIMKRTTAELVKRATSKALWQKRMLLNWNQANLVKRFRPHWRATSQSLAQNWLRLLSAYTKAKKALEPVFEAPQKVVTAAPPTTKLGSRVVVRTPPRKSGRLDISPHWKLPNVAMCFSPYWRSVKQSFVQDWKQFMRARASREHDRAKVGPAKPAAPRIRVTMAVPSYTAGQTEPKGSTQPEMLIHRHPPTLGMRFLFYMRAVAQSFLKDCKQFLESHPQTRKASGANTGEA